MVDLTEPLAAFRDLQATHDRAVQDYFEELLGRSGVDEEQNRRAIAELETLSSQINEVKRSIRKYRFGQTVATVVSVALAIWALVAQEAYFLLLVPAVVLVVITFRRTSPVVRHLKERQTSLESQQAAKVGETTAQVAPLNTLFSWGVPQLLVQRTIPELRFDRFQTDQSLRQLWSDHGLSADFMNGRSMLAVQSGSYRGNPFVLHRSRNHWMGTMVYTGTLHIQWTEQQRDSNGDWVTVQRSQILTASVTKPHPYYGVHTSLLYAHAAVPQLSFSRTASRLSGLAEGTYNDWRKDRAVKKVERKARRATAKGTSEFTVMANTEFEALFQAIDRDDEVAFRLMFTALAQRNMVQLLNDRTVSYGDDFAYLKVGHFNQITAEHLQQTDIDPEPAIFRFLSVDEARQRFRTFNADYFRSLYFAFAPLWTIPLLHDMPGTTGSRPSGEVRASSPWEHEVLAHHLGEAYFQHPASVTQNILRATSVVTDDGSSQVAVDAYGYTSEARVDIVPVLGGDGNFHNVVVPWTEYIPVERRSMMVVTSVDDPSSEPDGEFDHALLEEFRNRQTSELGDRPWVIRGGLGAVHVG